MQIVYLKIYSRSSQIDLRVGSSTYYIDHLYHQGFKGHSNLQAEGVYLFKLGDIRGVI